MLAHETHHCANYNTQLIAKTAPLLVMPAIAMLGVYLYDRAKQKAEEEHGKNPTSQQLSESLNNEVQQVEDALDEHVTEKHVDKGEKFKQGVITTAKYAAAGALGLAAGVLMSRMASRHFEFAADAFAAEAVGQQHMIDGLAKVHKTTTQLVSDHPKSASFQEILGDIFATHPSFQRRVNHINSLSI